MVLRSIGSSCCADLSNPNTISANCPILAKGKVKVVVDDEVFDIEAPHCFNIKANKHHGVLALEDCVWYCIHATDETDIDKIDDVLIKE